MAYPRTAAIVVASDRISAGEAEDRSGVALERKLAASGWRVVAVQVVPDDVDGLGDTLSELADDRDVRLILTTGGTGVAPRDVTPDATRTVADREVPGIAEALRAASMRETPHAMLSRATAVVRGRTLIVNLPGSVAGAESTLDVLAPVLDHALRLIGGQPDDSGHGIAGT